jgi:hypothetical protein
VRACFGIYETGKNHHSALAFTFVPAKELVFPAYEIIFVTFFFFQNFHSEMWSLYIVLSGS